MGFQGLAFEQVHGHEHGAGIGVPVEAEDRRDVRMREALLFGGFPLQGTEKFIAEATGGLGAGVHKVRALNGAVLGNGGRLLVR